MLDLSNCRSVPKKISERVLGEGDKCLREKETRCIVAWYAGMEPKQWERLKEMFNCYESVGYYDTKLDMVI